MRDRGQNAAGLEVFMSPIVSFRRALAIALGWTALIYASPASARPADLCTEAARSAAKRTGVPFEVLMAITLVETGRTRGGEMQPWPWAVNAGGEGQWFATGTEAESGVQDLLDQGATNIDIGCFQLNYRWHAENFSSLREMLDPDRNADYAARYLAGLHAKTKDWASAAAAYHSATPELAERYRRKFDAALAALTGDEIRLAGTEWEGRTNRFPLLIAGRNGQFGSLVPDAAAATPLIGMP